MSEGAKSPLRAESYWTPGAQSPEESAACVRFAEVVLQYTRPITRRRLDRLPAGGRIRHRAEFGGEFLELACSVRAMRHPLHDAFPVQQLRRAAHLVVGHASLLNEIAHTHVERLTVQLRVAEIAEPSNVDGLLVVIVMGSKALAFAACLTKFRTYQGANA